MFYDNLKKQVLAKVGGDVSRLNALEDLGLLSDELVAKRGSPIDTISEFNNFSSPSGFILWFH